MNIVFQSKNIAILAETDPAPAHVEGLPSSDMFIKFTVVVKGEKPEQHTFRCSDLQVPEANPVLGAFKLLNIATFDEFAEQAMYNYMLSVDSTL